MKKTMNWNWMTRNCGSGENGDYVWTFYILGFEKRF
jgi:hypothetical protein